MFEQKNVCSSEKTNKNSQKDEKIFITIKISNSEGLKNFRVVFL